MEVGYSRKLHYAAVLMKNLYQLALGILVWWLLGAGFGLGETSDNGFIGKWYFAGDEWEGTIRYLDAAKFGFFGMIVVFSINIPCVEKVQLTVQMLYTGFIMAFAYPVIVAWGWGEGWLYDREKNFRDPGGCGTIHLLAGAWGLMAVFIGGKRHNYEPSQFKTSSQTIISLGLFLFAIGQFMVTMSQAGDLGSAMKALWNSWLAGGSCCLTVTILGTLRIKDLDWTINTALEGFIAGVIAVASCATNTEGWDAFCIGWFVGIFVAAAIRLERWFKVDDVAHTIAWQFVGPFIGVILCGFFDQTEGVFHHGNGKQLGIQVLGAVVISAWGFFFSAIMFGVLRVLNLLRIPDEVQDNGLMSAIVSWTGFKSAPKVIS